MVHGQTDKEVVVLVSASVASTATATANIDTLGFDQCQVNVTVDDDTTAFIVLKLQESETSDGSFADITAFVGGGAGGFTMPVSAAATKIFRMNVDLTKRKRWLQLELTPGDAAVQLSANARLSRAHTIPDTLAEAGLALNVIG